jgi:hypothetical protein
MARAVHALDGLPVCAGGEAQWQAGRYRWIDVLWALRNDDVPADEKHPSTDAWATRGLVLPGPTIADQLAQLRRHPDYWRSSPATVTGSGGFLRSLARLAPTSATPESRLVTAAAFLTPTTRWPLIVFGLAGPTDSGASTE